MRELVRSRVGWVLLALLIVLEVLVGFANVSPGTLLAVTAVNLLVALVVAYHLMSVFRERDRFEEELAHLQEDSSFRPSPARFDLLSASVVRLNRMLEDQHHRQEPLREERDRYRAILDDFAEGVLLVDPEDRILYGNETARDFLDLPGSTRDRTLPELTRSGEIVRAVADARDTDEPVEREITRVEPDRETVLRLHAFRARDNVALVVRDVTRLHRLQTVRKDFVANVSHELKTPLAALRGLVETLRGDGEMDPSTRAGFLDRVRSQIESMTRMVEDLLTLSRLEGEKDETEEFVDVRGPAGDAIDSIRPRARDKNVNLQVEMPDEPLELPTSGTAIRQLVSNLVDNAVKYTPAGGEVRVTLAPENGTVRLEVADTGIGIEPRDQERIFERFYRVDEARSRDEPGSISTGLGLAIVKHVVRSMGGRIDLKSTPGRGSRFTVLLPDEASPRVSP